ncbi:acetolactate synthase [Maribellus sediminis]|uniref:acetolactate synthase n=1 Tax=Maribellus sediminis TaxID=2696285 RepID=UPI00143157BD|nr:acetolactate synthase [Maribellus sediminis]
MAYELSVFLENKIAHFEKITALLKASSINIRSLTLTGMNHGWGILNILVDQPEKAYQVLTDKGHAATLQELIALEMKDETGGLDELLVKISRSGIHVENAYTRLIAESKLAILLIEVPDVLEAKRRLEINHVSILDDKIVYGK